MDLKGIKRDLSAWGAGKGSPRTHDWAKTGSGHPRDTERRMTKPCAFLLTDVAVKVRKTSCQFYENVQGSASGISLKGHVFKCHLLIGNIGQTQRQQ